MPDGVLKKKRSDELMMGGERPFIPWNMEGPGSSVTPLFFGPPMGAKEKSVAPNPMELTGRTNGYSGFDYARRDPFVQPPMGKTVDAATRGSTSLTQTSPLPAPALGREATSFTAPTIPDLMVGGAGEEGPGFNWEVFASTFGELGAAVMGPFQDTWQAQLGKAAAKQAKEKAYSRYTDALMTGKEPDLRDASILTPEQKTAAFQIADMIEQRQLEKNMAGLEYDIKLQDLAQKREEFELDLAQRKVELGVKISEGELERGARQKLVETQERTDLAIARMASIDRAASLEQAQTQWEHEFVLQGKKDIYQRALDEAKAAISTISEYELERRVKEFNRIMRKYLGEEYQGIEEGEGAVGANADENYIP